jgi:hypothetical protein
MNQPIQIALPEETIKLTDRFTSVSESSEAILIVISNKNEILASTIIPNNFIKRCTWLRIHPRSL